ncbi:hypothetical protein QTI66_33290 [Variovorax sp. J22R133]|uniref:hypothetical protein n=1 Tax=Variovorax brevis TaxID=3053503 RepID=UPI002576DBCF|nr:hypothetical protein [Variovorax sp. J22R133]MDM0117000.1 hypothetical protein [Variovorax sp. J22R133]
MLNANSRISGVVEYRAGDGPMLRIPEGPCHIELAEDSAVLNWEEEGEPMNAAIPLGEYERFVEEGKVGRPA